MELTPLEEALLERIAASNPRLREALGSVVVTRREQTGAGSYTYLGGAGDGPADAAPVDGPSFESPEVEHGGGSLLWLTEGRPSVLEIFAYGTVLPETVRSFELVT